MVLFDLALIFTYSVKFLLKTGVSLKNCNTFLESAEKIFDFSTKIFRQFSVKIRNLEKISRKILDSLVFRKQKQARKHNYVIELVYYKCIFLQIRGQDYHEHNKLRPSETLDFAYPGVKCKIVYLTLGSTDAFRKR